MPDEKDAVVASTENCQNNRLNMDELISNFISTITDQTASFYNDHFEIRPATFDILKALFKMTRNFEFLICSSVNGFICLMTNH